MIRMEDAAWFKRQIFIFHGGGAKGGAPQTGCQGVGYSTQLLYALATCVSMVLKDNLGWGAIRRRNCWEHWARIFTFYSLAWHQCEATTVCRGECV